MTVAVVVALGDVLVVVSMTKRILPAKLVPETEIRSLHYMRALNEVPLTGVPHRCDTQVRNSGS